MRLLHTMLRVGNLEQSICFYTEILGMRLLKQEDFPAGEFILAFLGYDDMNQTTVLELTYNYGIDHYEIGTGFGHLAIEVEDVHHTCEIIKEKGGHVIREPGPMKHGKTVIAFVEDPDHYKIELVEKK